MSLLRGFGGFPGGGMPGAGGFASPATPPSSLPSLGMDFGGVGGRRGGGGRGPIRTASPGDAVNRAGGECPGRGGAGCSPGVCTRIGGGAGTGAGCARRRGYGAVWFCAAAAGAAVYHVCGVNRRSTIYPD